MTAMPRSALLLYILTILVFSHFHLSHAHRKCSKLITRKEWRTLKTEEKSEWIGAVKVSPLSFHLRLLVV